MDRKSGDVTPLAFPKEDSNYRQFGEFRALALDGEGNVWIGTYKHGVYVYDREAGDFTHLSTSDGLSHPEIHAIFKDSKGNMWVGTGSGVNLWSSEKRSFVQFESDSHQKAGLLGSIVEDIHETSEGQIWVAHKGT